jgi:hypothetical protein
MGFVYRTNLVGEWSSAFCWVDLKLVSCKKCHRTGCCSTLLACSWSCSMDGPTVRLLAGATRHGCSAVWQAQQDKGLPGSASPGIRNGGRGRSSALPGEAGPHRYASATLTEGYIWPASGKGASGMCYCQLRQVIEKNQANHRTRSYRRVPTSTFFCLMRCRSRGVGWNDQLV